MFKSRIFFIIFAILFAIYWFVLCPLLWANLEEEMNEKFDDVSPYLIPSLFWCGALVIFVIILLILWWSMCCLRKKYSETLDNGKGNLDSATIHNGSNKNIKDRLQMSELKSKSKNDAEAYQDIQHIFLRPNKDKQKLNTATQTSQTSDGFVDLSLSSPSSPRDFDTMRSSRRLSSCYSCSKSIPDDDMVNIFLNRLWTDDNDANDVKFEVVGKSVNQAKRFQIDDVDDIAMTTNCQDDKLSDSTNDIATITLRQEDKSSDAAVVSVPFRHSQRMKSEIFIMINDDSTVQVENGVDNVFK